MASNNGTEDSLPAPASILSKGGTGKNQGKGWSNKAMEAVKFSQYVTEGNSKIMGRKV